MLRTLDTLVQKSCSWISLCSRLRKTKIVVDRCAFGTIYEIATKLQAWDGGRRPWIVQRYCEIDLHSSGIGSLHTRYSGGRKCVTTWCYEVLKFRGTPIDIVWRSVSREGCGTHLGLKKECQVNSEHGGSL